MATPADLRSDLGHLTTLAGAELFGIFRDLERGAFGGEALHDLLPALVEKYGMAAATVTADWYDEMRVAAQVKAKFTAIPADIRDSGTHSLIAWAQSQTSDPVVMQQLVRGGATRRILNFSRQTVMGSSVADPGAHGWAREGSGASCDFCLFLINRGAVFSDDTADFASHDHCNCSAVPQFHGQSRAVLLDENGKRLTQSDRSSRTDAEKRAADNERIREWIKSHPSAG